jgi:hypothetical protein
VYSRVSEFADFINKAAVEGETTDAGVSQLTTTTPCHDD